MTPVVFVVVVD